LHSRRKGIEEKNVNKQIGREIINATFDEDKSCKSAFLIEKKKNISFLNVRLSP
jgi:hypothetical protein